MTEEIKQFIVYVSDIKKMSKNTEVSYQRDLLQLAEYLVTQGIEQVEKVTETSLNSYILYLEKNGRAAATISREIASIKAFFRYLVREGKVQEDPSENLRAPRIERKLPDILSVEKVQRLLEQPSGSSPKEIRDKAMMELMYATGLKVSEIITLKVEDVNMAVGFLTCHEGKKERMVPFGRNAKNALAKYLDGTRNAMMRGQDTDILFVNCNGRPMSRQGFWKILKYYGKMAQLSVEITPHTLRHCFAAHLLGNGADIHVVQAMLGHAGVASTQMYMALGANMNTTMRTAYQEAHPRK